MTTPPLDQVNGMVRADYFRYAAELLKLHPPHITDQPIVVQMQRASGPYRRRSFDPAQADPAVQSAYRTGARRGVEADERQVADAWARGR